MPGFLHSLSRCFLVMALLSCAALAQRNGGVGEAPRVGYVYPAGARPGSTVRVRVGGEHLKDVLGTHVSGGGVEACVLAYDHPSTAKELEALKEEAAALKAKRRKASASAVPAGLWTAEDESRAEYLHSRFEYRQNRQSAPAISEVVDLELQISPKAVPGVHELRLRTALGLSNPLTFVISDLPERVDPAAGPSTTLPDMNRATPVAQPVFTAPVPAPSLPLVFNGQIMPGERDALWFQGKKGDLVQVLVQARALLPYLADAVPGWFQSTISLVDSGGRELAYCDDYRFDPDPRLSFSLPEDGSYAVLIKDALFRGRQDFVYRVAVTRVSPTVDALMSVQVSPESADAQDDDLAGANRRTLPFAAEGLVDRPGDRDLYRFSGNSGAKLVAEVFARRLRSPTDSLLELFDSTGRRLASNDDFMDKGDGLNTHHADSRLQFTLPAAGVYFVGVRDVQGQGGPGCFYRLEVGDPKPGFELRMVPSVVNVRTGGVALVTVHALRRDGFDGEIRLGLVSPKKGFFLHGARIPAGQSSVLMTLGTTGTPDEEPTPLVLRGEGLCGGKLERRLAAPADDLTQAFAYHHLVERAEGLVLVLGKQGARKPLLQWRGSTFLGLRAGTPARLDCVVQGGPAIEKVSFELLDPSNGLRLVAAKAEGGIWHLDMVFDGEPPPGGVRGNVIIQVFGERPAAAKGDQNGKPGTARRVFLGLLPAMPYEVGSAASELAP